MPNADALIRCFNHFLKLWPSENIDEAACGQRSAMIDWWSEDVED
jgi:hypothetical protein